MSPRRRLANRVAVAIPLGLLVTTALLLAQRGAVGYDTVTYLAAGERLNAGHLLYALSAGDRPVYILPPYWTVPLVSPPLIAVIWRPLAALPATAGLWIWWAANIAALGCALLMLWRRRPGLVSGAMLVLFVPTAYEIVFGNMQGFLVLAIVLTWRWWLDRRDLPAGVIVGVAVALKVVPATLAWWLLVTGRVRAIAVVVATVAALAVVSLAGAGVDAHRDYLRIISDGRSLGIYELSLAGFGVGAGLDPAVARLLPSIAAGVGLVVVLALRRRPGAAFAVAVLTMIVGSPAVNITWFVLLYGALAPLAWPAPADADATPSTGPTG